MFSPNDILSSGLRILQISKRNLFDICQITHLIFGKIFGKLGKKKCEYIFVKKLCIFDSRPVVVDSLYFHSIHFFSRVRMPTRKTIQQIH